MSKQKKKGEIIELIQTSGENIDFFFRRFGEIPENLTKEQLRERYFRPEFFASDLHDKSLPELNQILADLKRLLNNDPLSRPEFEKLFTASGFVPPVITDEVLAKLSMKELHFSYLNNRDFKTITDEITLLQKIEK